MPHHFEAFLAMRREAASAYAEGDAEPVVTLSEPHGEASFFDPSGGVTRGAEAVIATYRKGASAFGKGGTTELEMIDHGSDGDVGFWTGFQHATVITDAKSTPMTLRITEVYRFRDGHWLMVHRHASMAKDQSSSSQPSG